MDLAAVEAPWYRVSKVSVWFLFLISATHYLTGMTVFRSKSLADCQQNSQQETIEQLHVIINKCAERRLVHTYFLFLDSQARDQRLLKILEKIDLILVLTARRVPVVHHGRCK